MAAPVMAIVQKIIGRVKDRGAEAKEEGGVKGFANAFLNPLPKEARDIFKKKDKLDTPELEDPTQTARLLEIDRISKNIRSGTDAATQTALQQTAATTAATQNRLSRVTGGNVGATTDALLKAQRAGGTASNQAVAQGQSRLPFFMNLG